MERLNDSIGNYELNRYFTLINNIIRIDYIFYDKKELKRFKENFRIYIELHNKTKSNKAPLCEFMKCKFNSSSTGCHSLGLSSCQVPYSIYEYSINNIRLSSYRDLGLFISILIINNRLKY